MMRMSQVFPLIGPKIDYPTPTTLLLQGYKFDILKKNLKRNSRLEEIKTKKKQEKMQGFDKICKVRINISKILIQNV